jgi:hypothetical protein
MAKKTHEVFGISNVVLPDSYVDRGTLDAEIDRLLARPTHVAIRGESKCGKSWLRQRNISNPIAVQCRLNKTAVDLYVDALSQLEISLEVDRSSGVAFKGKASSTGEIGVKLLAKLGVTVEAAADKSSDVKRRVVCHDVNDLRFVADIIRASGRRLVIEDLHYMSVDERRKFAFDLKALWDMGLFVVVVGVWSLSNMLIFLNPDLTGRMDEVAIYWSDKDLGAVLLKGGGALNIQFSEPLCKDAIANCFGNVGILQRLAIGALDQLKIDEGQPSIMILKNPKVMEDAAIFYAEQLNPLYQQFAGRVSAGIRRRKDSTGIYAHAMAVILAEKDEDLIKGIHLDVIFEKANARQPRIQKGNLRTVLEKFEELQVDEGGRGLVLSYNEATSEVSVVDRQLLLYRKYATVKWPWEGMMQEADKSGVPVIADGDALGLVNVLDVLLDSNPGQELRHYTRRIVSAAEGESAVERSAARPVGCGIREKRLQPQVGGQDDHEEPHLPAQLAEEPVQRQRRDLLLARQHPAFVRRATSRRHLSGDERPGDVPRSAGRKPDLTVSHPHEPLAVVAVGELGVHLLLETAYIFELGGSGRAGPARRVVIDPQKPDVFPLIPCDRHLVELVGHRVLRVRLQD